MSDEAEGRLAERVNLLLVLSVPKNWADDLCDDPIELADDLASGYVEIINEEWRRNSEHVPGYFQPLVVSAIPGPQLLDGAGLKMLVDSVRLMQQAHAMADES